MIGAIILAAGSSSRFGSDKRLAHLASGDGVMAQTVERTLTVFDAALLVLRHDDDIGQDFVDIINGAHSANNAHSADNSADSDSKSAKGAEKSITLFKAPDSTLGMGHSLANAIGEVQDWQAAFIVLGDMPFVAQQTLEALKAACQTAPAGAIIVPAFKGAPGHPVGFHRSHFNEIAALSGDKGARSVIDAHPTQVIQVAVEDEGILRDIDQPKDLN